jgi:hypothetical protein
MSAIIIKADQRFGQEVCRRTKLAELPLGATVAQLPVEERPVTIPDAPEPKAATAPQAETKKAVLSEFGSNVFAFPAIKKPAAPPQAEATPPAAPSPASATVKTSNVVAFPEINPVISDGPKKQWSKSKLAAQFFGETAENIQRTVKKLRPRLPAAAVREQRRQRRRRAAIAQSAAKVIRVRIELDNDRANDICRLLDEPDRVPDPTVRKLVDACDGKAWIVPVNQGRHSPPKSDALEAEVAPGFVEPFRQAVGKIPGVKQTFIARA